MKLLSGLLRLTIITSLALSLDVAAITAQNVRVVGLFKNTAVLVIEGQQRLIKVGQRSPEGVSLLSADATGAVVIVDGVQYRLNLTRARSGAYQERKVVSTQIDINSLGQYITRGSINGHSVPLLVDTGATTIAMNSKIARAMGIDFISGKVGTANTAGGVVKSYTVTLTSVKTGEIEVKNVRAIVIEGAFPTNVLLGMTYLSAVEINENDGLMSLTKKY